MELEDAIRGRRTTKLFEQRELDPAVVRELVELAVWAPNHHLTAPWRFRLIGPDATARLLAIAPPEKRMKLVRAPTRVLVTCVRSDDPVVLEEDLASTAAAVQNLLLAATAKGVDSFWQSPAVPSTKQGRAALGIPENEDCVAVVHLGTSAQERSAPARPPLDDVYSELT